MVVKVNNLSVIEKFIVDLDKDGTIPKSKAKRAKTPHEVVINRPKALTTEDFRKMIGPKSSSYINFLCARQMPDKPIYYCVERKNATSTESRPEKAFIFTIAVRGEKRLVVYENTIESRSTILFSIKEDQFHAAIDLIHSFFASDEENKRESIQNRQIKFTSPIIRYTRVIHDTYKQWLRDMQNQIWAL